MKVAHHGTTHHSTVAQYKGNNINT